jgi:hypothetical protein
MGLCHLVYEFFIIAKTNAICLKLLAFKVDEKLSIESLKMCKNPSFSGIFYEFSAIE